MQDLSVTQHTVALITRLALVPVCMFVCMYDDYSTSMYLRVYLVHVYLCIYKYNSPYIHSDSRGTRTNSSSLDERVKSSLYID